MARHPHSLKVLLVEDHLMSELAMRAILEHAGHKVAVAGDGGGAVTQWQQWRPDVILMDMQLPVMDGLTATRQIRQLEHSDGRARVVIIAMTANDAAADRSACQDAGMDSFLPKPVTIEQLVRALETARKAAE